MQQIFEYVESKIKMMFNLQSGDHDYHHLKRVFNLSMKLQGYEGGDPQIIGISSLTHDIHRVMERETGKYCHPRESLNKIEQILEGIDFNKKERVYHCVEFHEEYDFGESENKIHDIETQILQDADNLDAMGAIGIGRTFTFGGANNIPLFVPEKPFDKEYFDESVKDKSTIHHFYSKLLKLKDNMNTDTAKKLAFHRHKVMQDFLTEFFHEWSGDIDYYVRY